MTNAELIETARRCAQADPDCRHCKCYRAGTCVDGLLSALADALEAAEEEKLERENPKPLTLDELREMDGEPVWAIDGCGNQSWLLIDVDDESRPNGIDKDTGFWDGDFYGMTGDGKHGLHVMGWLAYRHKPTDGEMPEPAPGDQK